MMILLATLAAVSTTIFIAIQENQKSQVDLLFRERVAETDRVLRRILDLRASGARIHANDYSQWDDFVAFAQRPDPHWGKINLTESVANFGVNVAWVLNDRFDLVFTANQTEDPALAPLPVPLTTFASALKASPISHFFARTRKGVLEVWTSSIQPSEDFSRKSPPSGYYIIGRLWTTARLGELARLSDGTASLESPGSIAAGSAGSAATGRIGIAIPLMGLDGHPVAALLYRTTYPMAPRVRDALRLSLIVMLSGALVSFLVFAGAISRWVGRPLAVITASLGRQDPALLRRTTEQHDEFGHLARLVRDFFAQRQSLIEAREAAEAAAVAKSQFLANISHELRTPMHGILSYSRFGLREAMTAEREELLENFRQVEECGQSLLALLNDLLDLAKFDAGRMKFEFAEVSLDEVANAAADEFASLYNDRQLTLEVDIEDGLPPICADQMKVLQVFRNLLSNAAKFTPPGGHVTMRAETSGRFARVVVDDSGMGVPEGELELIFDKFTQASHTNPRTGGTGLGLALCREIAEAHEGRIWAENRPGSGTRLIFEVPIEGPAAASTTPPAPEEKWRMSA